MTTKTKNILIIAATLIIGMLLGWLFFGGSEKAETHDHNAEEAAQETIWTCSMHPQIRSAEPGQCPICGMDLIPLENADLGENPDAVQMSEYAMKLANVQTVRVGTGSGERELRLNGKINVDERNAYTQSTHVPGRIEQLLVNFTGEEVRRGQALAVVYSPDLITAQEELLQAYAIRQSQPELFEAAKQKLRNWRIGEGQINRILESGQATDRFTITADVSGVVTEKMVELGDYVERGMALYQIADLSKMWVLFDLYERTIGMVEEGDKVEFSVASLPGETFEGSIDFIDPLLDSQTRVATARVEIANRDNRLKPGMFVTGVITASGVEKTQGLTVPRSAVLWTGKRSIVYVNEGTDASPSFAMREVVLGQSLGDSYVVQEGLSGGDEVVVNGTFTVDAAAQLAGKPSMMNPQDESTGAGEQHDIRAYLKNAGYNFREMASEDFQKELGRLVEIYLQLKNALVEENIEASETYSKQFREYLEQTSPESLSGEARAFWEEKQEFLLQHAQLDMEEDDIAERRNNFIYLSEAMIKTVAAFGLENKTIYVDYCPMANSDKGAYWLSEASEIRNPYYGDAMLKCGEIVEEIK